MTGEGNGEYIKHFYNICITYPWDSLQSFLHILILIETVIMVQPKLIKSRGTVLN